MTSPQNNPIPLITLNNGLKMPQYGLGTYQNQTSPDALKYAIEKVGIRLIDTAMMYGNEEMIGNCIEEMLANTSNKNQEKGNSEIAESVPFPLKSRDELFIVTKLWPNRLTSPEQVRAGCEKSLKLLKTTHVDALLMHWPLASEKKEQNMPQLKAAWKEMEKLYREGKAKSIGVSNFNVEHLEAFLPACDVTPMINQFEMHPLLTQEPLTSYCQKHQIQPMSYRTLGKGALLENEAICKMASRLNKTPAQVILRWALQRDFVIIPKSSKLHRIKENAEIFDFKLSEKDMQLLSDMDEGHHYCGDPGNYEAIRDMILLSDKYPKP